MTATLTLIVILALIATIVVALEHNHSRNGRPRIAGFTGRIGALPSDRSAPSGARGPDA